MSALSVHLNRERPRDIDAPASFVADGPFDVAVENHGGGSHVHVRLDETLSRVARLRDGSQYVGGDGIGHLRVDTRSIETPVTGTLTISVGYGAETATVEVRVEPSRESGYGIDVDDDLGTPQIEQREPPDAETVALLSLAGVALLAAAAVAVSVGSTVVVAAAAFVALITVVGVVLALA
ncbi:hypothetical protein JCM30237_30130 [Halolamina litorea]|uniref:Uncharacterized protein n=1 Tax=Halolamina litorea TaxID=1515593 RepID=A0ABD6BMU5_9EURY|nr:hypothetical protein [Halolamina litorea]